MTTIATDGVTIAADGLGCFGTEVAQTDLRKINVGTKGVYALSGPTAFMPSLINWVEQGAKPAEAPAFNDETEWGLLVFKSSGGCFYSAKCPYAQPIPAIFALGSGADYAIGAMHAGLSPERAVRLVVDKRLDVYTGGDIQVIDIKDALGIKEPALRAVKG